MIACTGRHYAARNDGLAGGGRKSMAKEAQS
jgi:hypothetical protein